MEWEETIAGDAPPTGAIARSGAPIIGSASTPDGAVPAQLWRDLMNRWIGGFEGQLQASWARDGREAPPACWRHDALNFPQSGSITTAGITGGANVTDCTTGGETCALMS